MANPPHDKGNITDAEIAGYMGWRGPGAYTEASMRKIREIIDHVLRVERAIPPSPSTAPEVDERAAFEAHLPKSWSRKMAQDEDGGMVYVSERTLGAWIGWGLGRQELASRPAEVDSSPKPPRTPEEMVAFIGSHFDAMRDETSDPEDIRFTLSVHDLLSAMSDWFDNCAESAHSNEKAVEVDDEGLPPLPKAFVLIDMDDSSIWGQIQDEYWENEQQVSLGVDDPLFTAEQYRQGQRDAVAADRARRAAAGGDQ